MAEQQNRQPVDAELALERLRQFSLRETSMEALLHAVADVATEVAPGDLETSVSLLLGSVPTTIVSTGALAADCDESQYDHGDGPCLNAATKAELTEIADASAETRWQDYARHAAELGALSSLSVPLPIGEGRPAALNIYARSPNAFDEHSRSLALRLAPYAAVAIANMQAYQHARDMTGNLQAALESHAVIERATGIVMERHKVSADEAFHLLTRAAMAAGTKVADAAGHLVDTGELPLAAGGEETDGS